MNCEASASHYPNVVVPSFNEVNITDATPGEELRESCEELSEWLAMVAIQSPRVSKDDKTDPFLCRYSVPGTEESSEPSNLVSVKWHGLLPSRWIMELFTALLYVFSMSYDFTPFQNLSHADILFLTGGKFPRMTLEGALGSL